MRISDWSSDVCSSDLWWVAGRQPKHLAAMCAWEAANDYYREFARHGGILCTFIKNWYRMQVQPVQHGVGTRGYRSRVTGEPVAGPPTPPPETLAKKRADLDTDRKGGGSGKSV